MKMSPHYLAETAKALSLHGFSLRAEPFEVSATPGGAGHHGIRYYLERSAEEQLVLECILHADRAPQYFLQWNNYHGLSCTSFPLDSWKHFDDHVEFKFYALSETGMGLSLQLQLQPSAQ